MVAFFCDSHIPGGWVCHKDGAYSAREQLQTHRRCTHRAPQSLGLQRTLPRKSGSLLATLLCFHTVLVS